MGGGGGGSGFGRTASLLTFLLTVGSATTPGDNGNSLRGSYGNAGAVASAGTQGVVIIRYPGSPRSSSGTITQSNNLTTHTFTTVGINSMILAF
jgi:hypothetical protein